MRAQYHAVPTITANNRSNSYHIRYIYKLVMRNLIICLPAMIWPRILVFTSMMLRVLTPAAFGSYGAGIYIPKLGLVPTHVRPVRPVADLYDLLAS